MSTPYTVIVGRLTADPELRFTSAGKAVANFTIASSDRKKNQQTDEWEDGDKCFLRAAVWETTAENVVESLTKGAEVVAIGRTYQRDYTDKDDNKRTSFELKIDTIAAVIGRANTVKITKLERQFASAGSTTWAAPSTTDEPPF